MTENLVVCSKCGTINRLPPSRPAIDAKCGKCKAKVFAAHPEDVDAEIFDRQIARSTIPVLVDVWAPWCGPCRMMAPAYESAARELEPQVRLIKLNSDAEQAVASRLGIQGIVGARCASLWALRICRTNRQALYLATAFARHVVRSL